jgi:hypothetical protein
MDPERMRAAVADYVHALHRAYLAQADTFPPAVRGAMPLLAGGELHVAAVGARNLHLLATREGLGPLRGQEVSLPGSLPGLSWDLRFYDPVVVPDLGLISETDGPAYAEVRHALGIGTVVYHVVAQPGSGLTPHHAGHIGAGLAAGHSAAARDFETIRSRVRGRERLVDELVGAATAGLPRAQALLARLIAPRDATVASLAEQDAPDPVEVRRALLASVGGRSEWRPAAPSEVPVHAAPEVQESHPQAPGGQESGLPEPGNGPGPA